MFDISFLLGSTFVTILFRALAQFIVKKITVISAEKKMLWSYSLATILLFFITALGMADGGRTPWALGLTVHIPILGLFLLTSSPKIAPKVSRVCYT